MTRASFHHMASPSCQLHRVTQAVLNSVHGSEDKSVPSSKARMTKH